MSKDPAKRAVYDAAMADNNTRKIMEIQQVKEKNDVQHKEILEWYAQSKNEIIAGK